MQFSFRDYFTVTLYLDYFLVHGEVFFVSNTLFQSIYLKISQAYPVRMSRMSFPWFCT